VNFFVFCTRVNAQKTLKNENFTLFFPLLDVFKIIFRNAFLSGLLHVLYVFYIGLILQNLYLQCYNEPIIHLNCKILNPNFSIGGVALQVCLKFGIHNKFPFIDIQSQSAVY